MAAWQVLALISVAIFLAALLNYNLRVDKLVKKHDGLSLGFATRLASGRVMIFWPFLYTIDKTHPNYPRDLDRELQTLDAHRHVLIVAHIACAAFILFGIASKAGSWVKLPPETGD